LTVGVFVENRNSTHVMKEAMTF